MKSTSPGTSSVNANFLPSISFSDHGLREDSIGVISAFSKRFFKTCAMGLSGSVSSSVMAGSSASHAQVSCSCWLEEELCKMSTVSLSSNTTPYWPNAPSARNTCSGTQRQNWKP